jgi:methionine-rich copper-binding protein CopC
MGADNVVATFDLPNALSGKLLDTNGDNQPDQAIFTSLSLASSIEGGPLYTTIVNFTGWSNLNSTNTHILAELQTSTDPSLMFAGAITGTSSNPTTIIMSSYFMESSGNNGADTTNPTVTTFSPADGATGVAVGSDIVLTFSEAIQKGAGTIAIHSGSSTGAVVESFDAAISSNLIISGNTLTINPTSDLAQSTHYFVTISHGSIADVAGNEYAGSSSYDFTAGADSTDHHALGGNITFWKTSEAISDVTTTLSAMPIAGTQLVEFRDIHTNADGSNTVEIWATSSSDIASLQLEFMLSTGAVASWNSGDGLPSDWMSAVNTATGQFQLASITGAAALPAGTLKLGTLTVDYPTNAEHVELLLNSGTLGNNAVATTGIVFDSTTTGSGSSYHYLDVQDGMYSLTAGRAAGATEHSAVTAADALAALKMAVGLNPNSTGTAVSPYQYLAADVNHDGKIRSTDALNILKMAVGLETAPHDEWIFVSESVGSETMTRNHVDWSEAAVALDLYENMEFDLVGIVKGDVNGSWGA